MVHLENTLLRSPGLVAGCVNDSNDSGFTDLDGGIP